MPIPRVRFTIRLLMIAVAVVAAFLTAARLAYFCRHYQTLASMHASKAADYLQQAEKFERKQEWTSRASTTAGQQAGTWERMATVSGAMSQKLRRLASHESRLKQNYERVSRRPWLPVAPDPPEPE
jgi:Tfp pilus assembly protein PilE